MPRFGRAKRGNFDVVVIGGGITGLTAAYLLKQAGKTVCLLERGRLAQGDTGCTSAHLTAVTDLRLTKLAQNFGKQGARLVWGAGTAAIGTIEEIVRRERIACEFCRVPGYLCASLEGNRDQRHALEREAALAVGLGINADYAPKVPVLNRQGIRFADQAKFQPRQYLAHLSAAIDGGGSHIYEQSEAGEVKEKPLAVRVGRESIECGYVVIATHVPLVGKTNLASATLFQTKLYGYSSYVIAARLKDARTPEALFWDTSDPYYYLRIDRRQDATCAIFGGMDHKTGQETDTEGNYLALEHKLAALLKIESVTHRWSGQVIETNDGLPYIGETSPRQFAATGFAGNGMTFGTLAATMACDAVCGRDNPWKGLFDPHRKKIRGGTLEYLKENVDYPYYLVSDQLMTPRAKSTRAIVRGQAQVVKVKGQSLACYRDEKGKLHKVSAVCTHMGCLVRWNSAEKTWDCPCHGSRFQPDGEVLAGPAETPLGRPKRSSAAKAS